MRHVNKRTVHTVAILIATISKETAASTSSDSINYYTNIHSNHRRRQKISRLHPSFSLDDEKRDNTVMIEVEPPHNNDLSYVSGNDEDDDIVLDPPNSINFLVHNKNSNEDVCSIGCEGDYGEIFDTLDNLWKKKRKEYELFFMVQNRYAIAAGVIYKNFPRRVKELKNNFPDVDTLILVDVPGSADDNAMTKGSLLVHKYGYQTCVPSNGHTSSGGTDFFLSGFKRYATPGAKLGIHSWEAGGKAGNDFPKDHPSHKKYLDLYASTCIPEEFYWETLSHGVDPMYYIKEKEMKENVGKFHYMRDCTADAICDKKSALCKDDPKFRKRKGGCKKYLKRKKKKKCRRGKIAKACPTFCDKNC